MATTGLSTKNAAAEGARRCLLDNHRRRRVIDGMAGRGWDGDLDASRHGRFTDDRG